jgi:hypothetical protein
MLQQQQQQQQLSSNNKFKQACCHSLASSFKILQFPSTKHIITGLSTWEGQQICNNSNNKHQNWTKKPLTHHTQNHTKNKISTKSAQNEQNYFVKERKSARSKQIVSAIRREQQKQQQQQIILRWLKKTLIHSGPIWCNHKMGGNYIKQLFLCEKKIIKFRIFFLFCELWKSLEGRWIGWVGEWGVMVVVEDNLSYNFALGSSDDAPLPISTFSDPINCMFRII